MIRRIKKYILIEVLIIILGYQSTLAEEKTPLPTETGLIQTPANYTGRSIYGFNYYSFQDFITEIKRAKARTVVSGLKTLPQEFTDNFTLVRTGHALQQSSDEYPRAILFGDTGHLVVTFNGHPSQVGYDALETAEFDESTQRIYYRAVIFKGEKLKHPVEIPPEDIAFQNPNILVTKPNPAICMSCHTTNREKLMNVLKLPHKERIARYIWDEYPNWVNNWGSEDDTITHSLFSLFVRTKKALAALERYQILFDTNQKIETSYPHYTHDPLDPDNPINIDSPLDNRPRISKNMPNAQLTKLLSRHFAYQTANLLFQNQEHILHFYDRWFNAWCLTPNQWNYVEVSSSLYQDIRQYTHITDHLGIIHSLRFNANDYTYGNSTGILLDDVWNRFIWLIVYAKSYSIRDVFNIWTMINKDWIDLQIATGKLYSGYVDNYYLGVSPRIRTIQQDQLWFDSVNMIRLYPNAAQRICSLASIIKSN